MAKPQIEFCNILIMLWWKGKSCCKLKVTNEREREKNYAAIERGADGKVVSAKTE